MFERFYIKLIFFVAMCVILLNNICVAQDDLNNTLEKAADNKEQLKQVLNYYSNEKEKLVAVKYLISNLWAHTKGSGKCDASVITANYLIQTIDSAYFKWKEMPWARHVTFEEFCEWLLPYKVVETQSIDKWSEKLYNLLWDNIRNMPPDDDEYNTATKTALMVRQTLREKLQYNINLYGQNNLTTIEEMLYVKSATTSYYSQLLVAACRSVGVPAVLDESALKGLYPTTMFYDTTYKTANQWAVILTSQGLEMPIANDISAEESYAFFPYDKCPKVYRNTFAVNQRVKHYMQTAKYHYSFGLCKHDVTDKYFLTTDLSIPIVFKLLKMLKDSYVYIAAEVYMGNQEQKDWLIVDFGEIKDDCALFCKMGRDINYLIMGYNGTELIPISKPFQLCKNGSIKWLDDEVVEN